MLTISDAINARDPKIFMVEEARTSHLLDAAKLLPAILTGSSYVDCVSCFVLVEYIHVGLGESGPNREKSKNLNLPRWSSDWYANLLKPTLNHTRKPSNSTQAQN